MEFIIDRVELVAAIDKCELATDARSTNEHFRLMLVEATPKKKTVRFAAVGEFTSVDTVAAAEVKSIGRFTVKPSQLRALATAMPPGKISFALKGERITVKSMVSSRKATFQNHSAELRPVEDPGKEASWVTVSAPELVKALTIVKVASRWDVGDIPTVSLLIPDEGGLKVFGCNSYMATLVTTSIQVTGIDNLQIPDTAAAVLALMVSVDDNVNLYSDGQRVYLENCDTLVSALLAPDDGPQAYRFKGQLLDFILKTLSGHNPETGEVFDVGPTVHLPSLQQGLKSVLAMQSFAGDKEKGGSRGHQVHVSFGNSVVIELGFAEADARDEFAVNEPGSDLEFWIGSLFFEKMLSSIQGIDKVQALRASNMLVLRAQGVVAGIMEEVKK